MHRTQLYIALPGLIAALFVCEKFAISEDSKDSIFQKNGRPLIAVWCAHEGMKVSDAPYLRVAIWEDGQAIFAKDPEKWEHSLQEGKISPHRIKLLKKALSETGVFELKGNCYLVPDAPTYCITISIGDKKRTLYWDERESPNYGININPKTQHIEFKKCWKAVNNLALVACPDQGAESKEKFSESPESWRAEPSIQSE
jgi:hypothetical protein